MFSTANLMVGVVSHSFKAALKSLGTPALPAKRRVHHDGLSLEKLRRLTGADQLPHGSLPQTRCVIKAGERERSESAP